MLLVRLCEVYMVQGLEDLALKVINARGCMAMLLVRLCAV